MAIPQTDPGATTGDGRQIAPPPTDEPVMTTGDGRVLSGPDRGTAMKTEHAHTDTDDLTKADLMEKAKKQNIEGRSSMSKSELADAVE